MNYIEEIKRTIIKTELFHLGSPYRCIKETPSGIEFDFIGILYANEEEMLRFAKYKDSNALGLEGYFETVYVVVSDFENGCSVEINELS